MDEMDARIWARVSPEVRTRIRDEAERLYEGNESMLVRRAIIRFFDDLDSARSARESDVAMTSREESGVAA